MGISSKTTEIAGEKQVQGVVSEYLDKQQARLSAAAELVRLLEEKHGGSLALIRNEIDGLLHSLDDIEALVIGSDTDLQAAHERVTTFYTDVNDLERRLLQLKQDLKTLPPQNTSPEPVATVYRPRAGKRAGNILVDTDLDGDKKDEAELDADYLTAYRRLEAVQKLHSETIEKAVEKNIEKKLDVRWKMLSQELEKIKREMDAGVPDKLDIPSIMERIIDAEKQVKKLSHEVEPDILFKKTEEYGRALQRLSEVESLVKMIAKSAAPDDADLVVALQADIAFWKKRLEDSDTVDARDAATALADLESRADALSEPVMAEVAEKKMHLDTVEKLMRSLLDMDEVLATSEDSELKATLDELVNQTKQLKNDLLSKKPLAGNLVESLYNLAQRVVMLSVDIKTGPEQVEDENILEEDSGDEQQSVDSVPVPPVPPEDDDGDVDYFGGSLTPSSPPAPPMDDDDVKGESRAESAGIPPNLPFEPLPSLSVPLPPQEDDDEKKYREPEPFFAPGSADDIEIKNLFDTPPPMSEMSSDTAHEPAQEAEVISPEEAAALAAHAAGELEATNERLAEKFFEHGDELNAPDFKTPFVAFAIKAMGVDKAVDKKRRRGLSELSPTQKRLAAAALLTATMSGAAYNFWPDIEGLFADLDKNWTALKEKADKKMDDAKVAVEGLTKKIMYFVRPDQKPSEVGEGKSPETIKMNIGLTEVAVIERYWDEDVNSLRMSVSPQTKGRIESARALVKQALEVMQPPRVIEYLPMVGVDGNKIEPLKAMWSLVVSSTLDKTFQENKMDAVAMMALCPMDEKDTCATFEGGSGVIKLRVNGDMYLIESGAHLFKQGDHGEVFVAKLDNKGKPGKYAKVQVQTSGGEIVMIEDQSGDSGEIITEPTPTQQIAVIRGRIPEADTKKGRPAALQEFRFPISK